MPQTNSRDTEPPKMLGYYTQLGLEPGAPMRDIEASYWRFARALRGQAAMAPYTAAYEGLVNRVAPRRDVTPAAPAAEATVASPPSRKSTLVSKFGWPAA